MRVRIQDVGLPLKFPLTYHQGGLWCLVIVILVPLTWDKGIRMVLVDFRYVCM